MDLLFFIVAEKGIPAGAVNLPKTNGGSLKPASRLTRKPWNGKEVVFVRRPHSEMFHEAAIAGMMATE